MFCKASSWISGVSGIRYGLDRMGKGDAHGRFLGVKGLGREERMLMVDM